MKDLRGQATGTVSADAEHCFAVLLAVDGYPTAYPEVIRQVEVLERARDGSPDSPGRRCMCPWDRSSETSSCR